MFLRFVLLYLCILLVPVTICGMMYVRSISVIKDEINNSNSAALKQIQLSIDGELNNFNETAASINCSTDVQSLLYKKELTSADYLTVRRLLQNVKGMQGCNNAIGYFYLYFRESGLFITTDGSTNIGYLADASLFDIPLEFPKGSRNILVASWKPVVFGAASTQKSIVSCHAIPYENPGSACAIFSLYLNDGILQNILGKNRWLSSGVFYIVNGDGTVIYSSSGREMPISGSLFADSGDGVTYVDISGTESAVTTISSEQSGLQFLAVMPCSVYYQRLTSVRVLYIFSIALCLLLGTAMAVYFAKKNYSPIESILRSITKGKAPAETAPKNEYGIISEYLTRIAGENESIRKKMTNQQSAMKTAFIAGMVKGDNIGEDYIPEGLEYFGMTFRGSCFAVMLFSSDCSEQSSARKLKTCMTATAQKYSSPESTLYLAEIDGGAACLVNFSGENCGGGYLRELAEAMRTEVSEAMGCRVTAAVSGVHLSAAQISGAYSEALHAMEYHFLSGSGSTILFSDLKLFPDSRNESFNPTEMQKLANSIRAEDFAAARELSAKIIGNEFRNKQIPVSVAKCKLYGLVYTVIAAVETLPEEISGPVLEKAELLDDLLACRTVDSLGPAMDALLSRAQEAAAEAQKVKKDKLQEKMLRCIEEHYSDPNFNVSGMACSFGMSVDALSRCFKKSTGFCLLAYINTLRISKAKELLKNEALSVKTVAEQVGFSNCNTFIRVFKKEVGVTPGSYRESSGKEIPQTAVNT